MKVKQFIYDGDLYIYVCSFCGKEWEEEDNGFPLCCGEAADEWEDEG